MKKLFLGVVFLCIGAGVVLFGRHMLQEAGESESRPSTNGVIVVCTVS